LTIFKKSPIDFLNGKTSNSSKFSFDHLQKKMEKLQNFRVGRRPFFLDLPSVAILKVEYEVVMKSFFFWIF
jgi:hypothetical protein